MTKWEYKVEFLRWPDDENDVEILNEELGEFGEGGWELVAMHGYRSSPDELFVFKRPVQG